LKTSQTDTDAGNQKHSESLDRHIHN